jgi:hypothetical protein
LLLAKIGIGGATLVGAGVLVWYLLKKKGESTPGLPKEKKSIKREEQVEKKEEPKEEKPAQERKLPVNRFNKKPVRKLARRMRRK